jgi:outer membrane protein assembly factor BamB
MAGKSVYISCASSDASLLDMVSAALDAWEVAYTSLEQPQFEMAGQMMLPEKAQAAIRQAEVFLRLCTASTASSASMAQELHFYRALEVEDRSRRQSDRRTLINLILDGGYQREPFDEVTLFITTAGKTRAYWLDELARPLGVATQARRLGRRSAIVLGLAGGVTLLSATAAGVLAVRNQNLAAQQAAAKASPFGPGNQVSGQPAWPPTAISSDYAAAVKSAGLINPSIGLASDGNTLYAFGPDTIRALNSTAKGKPLWTSTEYSNIQLPATYSLETPLPYADSQVLVFQHLDAQSNLNLAVASSRTRSELWHMVVPLGGFPAGPATVVDTTLYCLFPLNSDWSVCAFDLHTGHVKWSYSIGTGTPHPAIGYAGGRVYIGDPYRCTCLNAQTGKKIWQQHLHTTVVATVLVSGGLALFGALDGNFYALDASSGRLRWRTNLAAPVSAQAVVSGTVVYVGDINGYLWALDLSSGNIYWRVFAGASESRDAGTSNAIILYPPVVYRNLVAVVAGDTLSTVDLISGTLRWPYQTQPIDSSTRGLATGPVLLGGYFAIGDAQNHIIALNP